MNQDSKKNEGRPLVQRRAYVPPAIVEEASFEGHALGCVQETDSSVPCGKAPS